MKTEFRVVPDTNVIIAAEKPTFNSPNREFLQRWKNEEFQVLYSQDMLEEYLNKLDDHHIAEEQIISFFFYLTELAEAIEILYFHHPSYKYPIDPDDIAFLLCADNGHATHLVTYNKDLLDVDPYHKFRICQTLPFLKELRTELPEH